MPACQTWFGLQAGTARVASEADDEDVVLISDFQQRERCQGVQGGSGTPARWLSARASTKRKSERRLR